MTTIHKDGRRTVMPGDKRRPGPLESLTLKDHCEMCGRTEEIYGLRAKLEAAFDPDDQPKTLCYECRIGSAELLYDSRAALLTACQSLRDRWEGNLSEAMAQINAAIAIAEGKQS